MKHQEMLAAWKAYCNGMPSFRDHLWSEYVNAREAFLREVQGSDYRPLEIVPFH